ncbi:hypothetical protein Baya_5250 [Bagarius yarrelli]|uniref:Uncharacterized protein n=1 Tax=Bagarius yarrelli TaxID=175774 RepID=A0A556TTZ6_BAGYA|nr:hypothetical protein Baya_5250 [Bagarius yarrelli]
MTEHMRRAYQKESDPNPVQALLLQETQENMAANKYKHNNSKKENNSAKNIAKEKSPMTQTRGNGTYCWVKVSLQRLLLSVC